MFSSEIFSETKRARKQNNIEVCDRVFTKNERKKLRVTKIEAFLSLIIPILFQKLFVYFISRNKK